MTTEQIEQMESLMQEAFTVSMKAGLEYSGLDAQKLMNYGIALMEKCEGELRLLNVVRVISALCCVLPIIEQNGNIDVDVRLQAIDYIFTQYRPTAKEIMDEYING